MSFSISYRYRFVAAAAGWEKGKGFRESGGCCRYRCLVISFDMANSKRKNKILALFFPAPNQLKKWHKNTWKWRSKWAGWERTWYISILVIHSIQRFQTRIEKWMSKRRRIFVVVEFFMSRIRKTHQSKRRAGSSASGMRDGKNRGDISKKSSWRRIVWANERDASARSCRLL